MVPVNCDKIEEQDGWKENRLASIFAIVFCLLTLFTYVYNGFRVAYFHLGPGRAQNRNADELQKVKIDISILSGIVASGLGLVFLFTAISLWPQMLEAAAIVTVVFAQLSALVWQDRHLDNPEQGELLKTMIERIPDIFAVILATLTMRYTRQAFVDQRPCDCSSSNSGSGSGSEFIREHDPVNEVNFSYILTGVAAGLGMGWEFLTWKRNSLNTFYKFIHSKLIPALFFLLQLGILIATLIYGVSTLADGCALFNATKKVAITTLSVGSTYSFISTVFYIRARHTDPEPQATQGSTADNQNRAQTDETQADTAEADLNHVPVLDQEHEYGPGYNAVSPSESIEMDKFKDSSSSTRINSSNS